MLRIISRFVLIFNVFLITLCCKNHATEAHNLRPMEEVNFEGIIFNRDQEPLSEVSIVIVKGPGDRPDIAALSNENGEFSFSDLKPGEYTIKFTSETFNLEKVVQVKKGSSKHKFVLP